MISVCRNKPDRKLLELVPKCCVVGIRFSISPTGKIVEIDANEDSEAVAEMLKKKAAAGVAEAMSLRL